MDLVINPALKSRLEAFIKNPSAALAISGPGGFGKKTLATYTAEQLLGITSFKDYPYGLTIAPSDSGTITIDQIRSLDKFLALKTPLKRPVDRVAIITDSHYLSVEAQNAILKTLEEPPAKTVLILSVSNEQALLPTVRSRLTFINVVPSTRPALKLFFSEYDEASFNRAYAMSGGAPGLMKAILNQEDHPLIEAAAVARQILSRSTYERLLLVEQLSKKKQLAIDSVNMLQQMAQLSLLSAKSESAKRWQRILRSSYRAAVALNQNGQVKLVLTDMMLHL